MLWILVLEKIDQTKSLKFDAASTEQSVSGFETAGESSFRFAIISTFGIYPARRGHVATCIILDKGKPAFAAMAQSTNFTKSLFLHFNQPPDISDPIVGGEFDPIQPGGQTLDRKSAWLKNPALHEPPGEIENVQPTGSHLISRNFHPHESVAGRIGPQAKRSHSAGLHHAARTAIRLFDALLSEAVIEHLQGRRVNVRDDLFVGRDEVKSRKPEDAVVADDAVAARQPADGGELNVVLLLIGDHRGVGIIVIDGQKNDVGRVAAVFFIGQIDLRAVILTGHAGGEEKVEHDEFSGVQVFVQMMRVAVHVGRRKVRGGIADLSVGGDPGQQEKEEYFFEKCHGGCFFPT